MKIIEIVLIISAVLAFVANLLLWPGSGSVLIVALTGLALLYWIPSWEFIKLPNQNPEEAKFSVYTKKILVLPLVLLVLAILSYIRFWSNSDKLLIAAVVASAVFMGVVLYKKMLSNKYINGLFIRISLIGLIAVVCLFAPKTYLLELKYKDHPGYVQALKNAMDEPGNETFQKVLQEETRKMEE